MIQNPVLPGFNPDPSIVRVGEDFYIATSTFQWFPGVNLHHSKDLIHWEHIGYALTRRSQLDMVGNPDSGGIWAPDLSYHDGTFHLIYTDVKVWRGAFEDAHNYLVTAQDIRGPWSEPIYLNSSGFDPSLFHNEDGRKWFVNALWDHRAGRKPFAGIVLQEYSPEEKRLVGPIKNIFKGTDIPLTESFTRTRARRKMSLPTPCSLSEVRPCFLGRYSTVTIFDSSTKLSPTGKRSAQPSRQGSFPTSTTGSVLQARLSV